jgi:hypothetical protein
MLERSRMFEMPVTMFGNAVAVMAIPIEQTIRTSSSEIPFCPVCFIDVIPGFFFGGGKTFP